MKRLLVALAFTALTAASPAFANPNDGGNLPGCDPSGQTPQKCDGGTTNNGGNGGSVTVGDVTLTNQQSQNQSQGQAQGQFQTSDNTNTNNNSNSNTNVNANSNSNSNSNTNTNNNTNVSSAVSGSTSSATGGNASATGGTSSASSSSQGGNSSTNNSGNSTNNVTVQGDRQVRQYRVVAPAVAPLVVASSGQDSCQGSVSGGVGTGIVNMSFGKTTQDNNCRRIKLSRRYEELGMPDVACQILALDPEANEAMRRAHRDCGIDNFTRRQPAPAAPASTEVATTPERG